MDEKFRRLLTVLDGRDAYLLLGIPRTADREQIRRASRLFAAQWHPDRWPAEETTTATAMFTAVQAAGELLTEPPYRAEYDRSSPVGSARTRPPTRETSPSPDDTPPSQPPPPPPPPPSPPRAGDGTRLGAYPPPVARRSGVGRALLFPAVIVFVVVEIVVAVFVVARKESDSALSPESVVDVGRNLVDIAVDPVTHAVYLARSGDAQGALLVADPKDLSVRKTIPIPGLTRVVASAAGNLAYTLSGQFQQTAVSIIDTATGVVRSDTRVYQPRDIVVDPTTGHAYISHDARTPQSAAIGGAVTVVDMNAVTLATIPLGSYIKLTGGGQMALDPGSRTLSVVHSGEKAIYQIDTRTDTVVRVLPLPDGTATPGAIAIDPGNNVAYLGWLFGGPATAFDLSTFAKITTVEGWGGSIDCDPGTHTAYLGGGTLVDTSTHRVKARLPENVGGPIAFDHDRRTTYVLVSKSRVFRFAS